MESARPDVSAMSAQPPLRILGLTGRARSGKDTFADVLVAEYGYHKMAFADPLKNGLAAIFGVVRPELDQMKESGDPTIRRALQTLGTEWGRVHMGQDFWASRAYALLQRLARAGQRTFVFTDVRFENEATLIQNLGGLVVHVDRKDAPEIAGSSHASEQPISHTVIDFGLRNDSTMEHWQNLARRWGDLLRGRHMWDEGVISRSARAARVAMAN